eukprot:3096644-Pyramimonas_sp.AAC.1
MIKAVQPRDGIRTRNAHVALPIFSQSCQRSRNKAASARDIANARRPSVVAVIGRCRGPSQQTYSAFLSLARHDVELAALVHRAKCQDEDQYQASCLRSSPDPHPRWGLLRPKDVG